MNIHIHTKGVQKYNKGFTLVETLIAVTILATAVAGTMTIAFQGLRGAQLAKDELVASYLAQEGVDFIRAWRDQNYLSGLVTSPDDADWVSGLVNGAGGAPCATANGCTVDMTDPTSAPDICGGVCNPLTFDPADGLYSQEAAGGTRVNSPFTRTIRMSSLSANKYHIVTVTMTWQTGPISRQLVLREVLSNWQSQI
mgnify:CR=1 FL=1